MVKLENLKKDITYELVDDKGELTKEDKEKVLKLAEEIEEDIAKELEQFGDNIQKILTTKIVREHEGRKETFTLLHHAMLHGNEEAINDISEKAKEHKLFEQISNEKIITEYWSDQGKLICASYSTAKYKNGVVSTETFETQEIDTNAGIITTYTKPRRSDKNSLNNENFDDARKHPVCESSEKDTTTLTETATQGLSASNSADEGNTLPPTKTKDQTKPCSHSEPKKENVVNEKEKSSTKTTQQRQAIMAGGTGIAFLVSGVVSCALGMYVIAVVGGIVGLVYIGFALYNVRKPSTQLKEVKDVECSRKSPEVAL